MDNRVAQIGKGLAQILDNVLEALPALGQSLLVLDEVLGHHLI